MLGLMDPAGVPVGDEAEILERGGTFGSVGNGELTHGIPKERRSCIHGRWD